MGKPVSDLASMQQLLEPLFPGLMGMELIDASAERVVASMRVRPDLCTVGGILHGGALMAFADTLGAIGTLLNLPEGARTATIESSTKFLAAAPVASVITGDCTPLHRGKTTMVWQTMIRTEAGKLCGVVSQTQLVLRP
jgi:1,4-dihydroxy-2-naphthoyl-CoA hydrolase